MCSTPRNSNVRSKSFGTRISHRAALCDAKNPPFCPRSGHLIRLLLENLGSSISSYRQDGGAVYQFAKPRAMVVPKKPVGKKDGPPLPPLPGRSTVNGVGGRPVVGSARLGSGWGSARVQRGGPCKSPTNVIGFKRVFPMRHVCGTLSFPGGSLTKLLVKERDAEIEGAGEGERAPHPNPKVSFATPKIDPSLESASSSGLPPTSSTRSRADVCVHA